MVEDAAQHGGLEVAEIEEMPDAGSGHRDIGDGGSHAAAPALPAARRRWQAASRRLTPSAGSFSGMVRGGIKRAVLAPARTPRRCSQRSEERRVWHECVSPGVYRGS